MVGSVGHWSWDVTFAFLALHFKSSAGRSTFWALWWDRANRGVHSRGRPCREVEACRTRRESEKHREQTEARIYNNHNCHVRHYHSLTSRPPTSHTPIHTVDPRRAALLPPPPAPLQKRRLRTRTSKPSSAENTSASGTWPRTRRKRKRASRHVRAGF